MLTAKVTAKAGGYQLSGDVMDLEALYSSLHAVCEDRSEGEVYPENLVFQLAYDVRKAMDGNRGEAQVPGFDDEVVVYRAVTLSLTRAVIQFAFIFKLVRGRQVPMKHTAAVHAFGATAVSALEQLKFPVPEQFLSSVVESVDSWPEWPAPFVVDSLDRKYLFERQTRAARIKELKQLPLCLRYGSDFAAEALHVRDEFARERGVPPEHVLVKWPEVTPKY